MGIDPETMGDHNLRNLLLEGYKIINAIVDLFGEEFNRLHYAKEKVLEGLGKGIRFSKAGEANSAVSADMASRDQNPDILTHSAGNVASPVSLEPITVWVSLSGEDIEKRGCPICGLRQGMILAFNVINGQRLPIIRCAQDKMVFLALTPNENWWEKVYNDPAYFSSDVGMGTQNHPFGYPMGEYQTPRHKVDAEIRIDEVERLRQGRHGYLLDIGAGYGYLLKEAKDLGWKVAGVELNSEAIQKLRAQEIPTIETTWESAEITPQSVDVLTFYDMLEHFQDPRAALRKAKLALKDDGLLVIRVPDLSNLTPENAHTLLEIAREHVSYFTKATLRMLLVRNGYEIISIVPSGHQVIGGSVIYASITAFAHPVLNAEPVTVVEKRDMFFPVPEECARPNARTAI